MKIDFKSQLNEEQFNAVVSQAQSNLILAGAGTGKTRTLTYRVAWLLEQCIDPENILLLTFTNKAAKEMLFRVEELTGVSSSQFYGGTFHHICQKLLRRHLDQSNFAILDADDAFALFTEAVRGENADFHQNKSNPSLKILYEIISFANNCRITIEDLISDRYHHLAEYISQISVFERKYRELKDAQNVMDYDDLLTKFVSLLENNTEIAEKYNNQFKHILVDEYQDTNPIQMRMIELMARDHQIFAVGDDAQCIYTWRGADIKNIIDFPKHHPHTAVVKIQTNYRSSPEILNLANDIPVAESFEYQKTLKSTHKHGRMPLIVSIQDARAQASYIIKRILGIAAEGGRFSEIAVLYRAHYQSMELQMELTRHNIPFTITSGIRFFEQAHIKDVLAFLRLISNPKDSRAFVRLFTRFPKVGEKTAEKVLYSLFQLSEDKKLPIFSLLEEETIVKKIPVTALEYWWPFARLLKKIYESSKNFRLEEELPQEEYDLFSYVPQEKLEKFEQFESISEIILAILDDEYREYLKRTYSNCEPREVDIVSFSTFCNKYNDLSELIQQVTLIQSEITGDENESQERIRLSTVHQAKGLEYDAVFILGLNENAFPLKRAIENDDVGEERRLFYVAVTRAKKELYLCCPQKMVADPKKSYFAIPLQPSRFISEIDPKLYEMKIISAPRQNQQYKRNNYNKWR